MAVHSDCLLFGDGCLETPFYQMRKSHYGLFSQVFNFILQSANKKISNPLPKATVAI